MKIQLDWLRQFVDYDGTAEELADTLWSLGLESEKIDEDLVEVEITANRGDCLSVLGVARELSAKLNSQLKIIDYKLKIKPEINKKTEITFDKPDICPRYSYYIIDNIEIKESPKWVKERLEKVGFRPINNIVDATNLVMLELGQPLHAFDFDKIKNGKMNIRLSKKGEEVMTLDGKNNSLPDGAIVIEDDEKIFDLAGIMGGFSSEVDKNTKTILLQSAIFDPVLIRKTSKLLNKTTDASYRYERNVDYEGTIDALNRTVEIIAETATEIKIGELIDIKNQQPKETRILFSAEKINSLLGTDFSNDEVNSSLERLGFIVYSEPERGVIVPSWREFDVSIWQDLAEEIARLNGYDKIQNQELAIISVSNSRLISDFENKNKIRDYLRSHNFDEVINYSFGDEKEIELIGIKEKLPEIIKPVNPEIKNYRGSLIPGLVKAIAKNPWLNQVSLFEIGDIWKDAPPAGGEQTFVGVATTGKLKIDLGELKTIQIDANHPLAKIYKLKRLITVGEMEISQFSRHSERSEESSRGADARSFTPSDGVQDDILYSQISKFPPTVRDIAVVVDKNVDANEIKETIKKVSGQILIVELFDEYESDKIGADKISLAYHIIYQDLKKTMTDNEVEAIHQKVVDIVKEKFNAGLRV